jgi:hypothetical protein
MTPQDHIIAAQEAVKVLVQGNLTKQSKFDIVRYLIEHLFEFLKGS